MRSCSLPCSPLPAGRVFSYQLSVFSNSKPKTLQLPSLLHAQSLDLLSCKYRANTGHAFTTETQRTQRMAQWFFLLTFHYVIPEVFNPRSLFTALLIRQHYTMQGFGVQNGNQKRQPETAKEE